jgi:hypothetical protein
MTHTARCVLLASTSDLCLQLLFLAVCIHCFVTDFVRPVQIHACFASAPGACASSRLIRSTMNQINLCRHFTLYISIYTHGKRSSRTVQGNWSVNELKQVVLIDRSMGSCASKCRIRGAAVHPWTPPAQVPPGQRVTVRMRASEFRGVVAGADGDIIGRLILDGCAVGRWTWTPVP